MAYRATLRDKIVVGLANLILGLATLEYRSYAAHLYKYGMDAYARDRAEGRMGPPPWRQTGGIE